MRVLVKVEPTSGNKIFTISILREYRLVVFGLKSANTLIVVMENLML